MKKRDVPRVTDAGFKQRPMPHVPFAPSGSDELQANVSRVVTENPGCTILLLEQHGITTLGSSIVNAFYLADLAEELARKAHLAERL